MGVARFDEDDQRVPTVHDARGQAHPAPPPARHSPDPRAYAVLSIGAALVTMALKLAAYFLTNSVGLFSDAAESGINLVAALAAFGALTVAGRPPPPAKDRRPPPTG